MKAHPRTPLTVALLFLVPLALAGDDSIARLLKYRALDALEVSPDGTRGVFVATLADLEENTMNSDLWLIDLSNGRSFQLTRGPKRDSAPAFSPDGRTLAFLSDRGGEKTNIWLISPDGGEAWPATKFDKLSVARFEWLPDSKSFLFTAADPPSDDEEKRKKDKNDPLVVDKDFKYSRLYRFQLGDKEPVKLTKEDSHVTGFSASPDGHWVAFSVQPTPKVPDARRSDLKLLDLETGEVRPLVSRPGLDSSPEFSPDGQWVAFLSTAGRDEWLSNRYLHVVHPDGSELRNLSQAFDENAGEPRWSPDARWLYFLAGQGVADRLFRLEVATGKFEPAGEYDLRGVTDAFALDPKGRFALVAFSEARTPAELYRLPLAGGAAEKLTGVNADFVDTAPLTEVLRYRSPDGFTLEGLLIKPKDFQANKRYPLLVVVHGGPSGAFNLSFAPRRGAYPLHAFAEQGYVLFLPNFRGSGSYGERFRRANYRDWGYGDYQDIMQGVEKLIQDGVADPERLGVMGWSYGGYMTSWIVTQTPRFKAASMGAGIGNVFSLYGNTDIPEALEAYFGGPPWGDAQNYLRHSAINFVGNARTPTLIQHGADDRRVRVSQSEEFYQALSKLGVPVEMVVYPRQPHGLQEPRLLRDALERNLRWFNKWLLGLEPPTEKKEPQEDKKPD